MSSALVPGTVLRAAVPATSANLGPGYDTLGLAVELRDEIDLVLVEENPAERVSIQGEGAGSVPLDSRHLVVRVIEHTLDRIIPGERCAFVLRCRNVIPHSRGLGSSAAAVVAGVSLGARLAELLGAGPSTPEQILQWATDWEGHPDNASPALHGGVTVSWMDGDLAHTAQVPPHPELRAVQLVPDFRLDTAVARSLIPSTVPHARAAANSARAALLIHAISHDPSQLLPGTVDLLHQEYRRPAMPETLAVVDALRAAGIAATVSGAGPTVLALGGAGLEAAVRTVIGGDAGFAISAHSISTRGVQVSSPEVV